VRKEDVEVATTAGMLKLPRRNPLLAVNSASRIEQMMRFVVTNKNDLLQFEHLEGPLEFGRLPGQGLPRKVLNDPYVAASHLRLEELEGGIVRVTNLSERRRPVDFADGTTIEFGETYEVGLPTELTIGETLIEIRSVDVPSIDPSSLLTIAQPLSRSGPKTPISMDSIGEGPSVDQLARWFESVIAVQRAAASSPNFYDEIARAVVELVGLDYAMVLLRSGPDWNIVSRYGTPDAPPMTVSQTVLHRVRLEKRTFYQASGLSDTAQSLSGVSTVVASPVLDSEGKTVLGVVYGAKFLRDILRGDELKPLHAQLIQVLAAAAGAGIARMRSEMEAARRHVQFEQFFSPELSNELDRNPDLLIGQDREVTILVSDIRGFSRIAEQLGPRETCELLGDVLERLTARIKENGGVVVDYVGDGILAMWNAPLLQPDHAQRACRAAMAMIRELSGLNERWAERTGTRITLGVGLNTGEARVGNTGSSRQLKYGPLGNTVNLASRVEGATKQLGVPVLITEATHRRLERSFATRRLFRVRVVGINEPVLLYELHGEEAPPLWLANREMFENALTLYEKGHLSEACRALFSLLGDREGKRDKPSLILAGRAILALQTPTQAVDSVVVLDSK
jgi:adenylate cyclase